MSNAGTTQAEFRLLRLPEVLEYIPIGRSTWWAGVKSGRFPKPVKLGPRTTAWRWSDIQGLIDKYPHGNTSP